MTVFEGQKACREFFDLTKIQLWNFKDNLMIAATNSFQLDIIRFDDYLLNRYPEYRDALPSEKMSMSKFITKQFGERANQIIDEMIK